MDMIKDVLMGLWESSGFAALFVDGAFLWQNLVMILVSFVLLYFAIAKKCEPLLLVPIAFGILLANLPGAGLMDDPTGLMDTSNIIEGAHWYDSGVLRLIYAGVKSSTEGTGGYGLCRPGSAGVCAAGGGGGLQGQGQEGHRGMVLRSADQASCPLSVR